MSFIVAIFFVAFLLLILPACPPPNGNGTPTPTPGPTASPTITPTPTPNLFSTQGPLSAVGNIFHDRFNNDVVLLGAIICCEDAKQNGWPFVTDEILDKYQQNKINFTHVRIGPNTPNSEGPEFCAYKNLGNNKVDLNQWDENFWGKLRTMIYHSQQRGIYVEISLIDAWVLERQELTPWAKSNNTNGIDSGNCQILSSSPKPIHEAWLKKVAKETGEFDNVLYEIGNETFDCDSKISEAWEKGVATIMRDELLKQGFGLRPIGTNSHKSSIENANYIDYVNKHQKTVPTPLSKPTMVNEYDSAFIASIGPTGFDKLMREAFVKGVSFHLWRGDMNKQSFESSMLKIKEFKK